MINPNKTMITVVKVVERLQYSLTVCGKTEIPLVPVS